MDIPEPFAGIVRSSYAKAAPYQSGEWVTSFFDLCFADIIASLDIPPQNYQARATKTGEMFEYAFYFLLNERYRIGLEADFEISNACMVGNGALDFALVKGSRLLCGIEAKGSAARIKVNGYKTLPRPALKRTDTVKKAIAQAYQFKRVFPSVPFFIVTNVKPEGGNAKCMLDLAEGDIVDRVVNLTDLEELDDFANRLRLLLSN